MKRWLWLFIVVFPVSGQGQEWFWRFENRLRVEAKDNLDFQKKNDDGKTRWLYRSRLEGTWKPKPKFLLFLQGQMAQDFSEKGTKLQGLEEDPDIAQAYAQFGAKGSFLRLGRQELSVGEERLIGAFDWSNVGRRFDAIRWFGEKKSKNWKWQTFAGRVVNIDPQKLNRPIAEEFLGGVHLQHSREGQSRELAYFFRQNRSFGLNETTVDYRAVASRGKGKAVLEAAYQFGNEGSRNIRAFAGQITLGVTGAGGMKPSFEVGFDYATGDSEPNDETRKTFDNLFPTNHKFYGYLDLAAWKNLQNRRASLSLQPAEKWKVKADVHFLSLATTADAWYAASGAVFKKIADAPSRRLGMEGDFTALWSAHRTFNVLFGASVFAPGPYAKAAGGATAATFFYLQLLSVVP